MGSQKRSYDLASSSREGFSAFRHFGNSAHLLEWEARNAVTIWPRVQDNLRQGVLPQSQFLPKHPRQDHQHPLALSPQGFPEYFLHEGLPHDYGESSEEEVIEKILLPFRNKLEENSEYAWLIKDMLFNPMEEGKTIKKWLTGELLPVTSGVEVEIHPEEKLQRKSESERISGKVNTDSHSSLSLWDSFVSTIPEPPGQRAQTKTI